MFTQSSNEPAEPMMEGAYRRGYVQAVAEVSAYLSQVNLSNKNVAAKLYDWSNFKGAGDIWRKDQPLDLKIPPPQF